MTGPNYWQRKYTRRGMLAKGATAGLGTAGFALVGCGGGDDDEEPLDLESIPTADATKQQEAKSILWPREDTTAKAVKGEIYQAYTTADVTNLDPLASPSFTANSAGSWYYPRLLSYKPGYKVPSKGEVQGYLGATWEQPEPTRVVFKLRPNAVWENKAPLNKRAIDAEDVVFSWNKFAAQNTSRKDLAKLPDNPSGPVESVKAIDKTTVEFKLQYPYAPFLSAMAYSRYLQVMPRESDGGYDPRNEVRSGGPWILDNYQRSVIFQYRKNPDYWDASNVLLNGFDIPIIPEYAAGLAQFRAKKVWAFAVRQEEIIQVKKEVPELALDQGAHGRTAWMTYFGLKPGTPFADDRVRRAASMLIDRDLWIDTFYNVSQFRTEGYPTDVRYHSHISAGWEGLWVDPKSNDMGEGKINFTKNVAEAKKLLEAAGYTSAIESEIAWIATGQYGTTFPKNAEVIKGMLEESGLFKLKQVNPDYQTDYLPKYYFAKGDFTGIAVGATTAYPEVDQFMNSYYHSKGARQKTSFQGTVIDQKSDDMIDAQRKELDAGKRAQIIKDWQKYAATKMIMIPYPGQSPAFSLFWPWIGNAGVFRAWDAESGRDTTETKLWFDKSKYTG
ncbi:MAG: ABC transporter substrate-binding protein [Dehalococcoidia bacterium]|uniref:ABC transporter substrate-binding protein n=1 Tax=Candidatus Amarobacter glycogenicus TaxID=3140699 RepID=UPI0031356EB3|nr:ABC transporter substrate-binding protein [Dehalococcoidia bacterium]